MSALLADPDVAIVLTGALVGVAASLLGTFLVLRGSSMLSDAISHSIVFGIVVVWLLTREQSGPVQIVGAALTGLLTVWLTELLARTKRVKDDAAIGLVFPALFAAGVLLLNVHARDVHVDEHTVLLGEIGFVWLDVVEVGGVEVPRALLAMSAVTALNLLFVGALFKELKLATFDPGLARALGFAPGVLFYALLMLVSCTAVAAFDAVGAVLFIAFVIVPPSAAHLLTDRLWATLVIACAIAVASSFIGYIVAVALDVSIGGSMALATGGFLAAAFLFGPRHGLVAQEVLRRGQRRADRLRTLAVHLHNHENTPDQREENVAAALREHLAWSEAQARETLLRGLDEGLVRRDGELIRLTEKGRATAREILEPWNRAAA